MTRRPRPQLPILLAGLALAAAIGNASAAEIAGAGGAVTVTYDETLWAAELDQEQEPELACAAEACGGDTAGCGFVVVRREGVGLTEETFVGTFRENLGERALESARTTAGENSSPEIVSPASVASFGDNTGVSLSMRVAFDGNPTRVDHFWLLAGADLAGLVCVVADAEHGRARPAFERIFADLKISAP